MRIPFPYGCSPWAVAMGAVRIFAPAARTGWPLSSSRSVARTVPLDGKPPRSTQHSPPLVAEQGLQPPADLHQIFLSPKDALDVLIGLGGLLAKLEAAAAIVLDSPKLALELPNPDRASGSISAQLP